MNQIHAIWGRTGYSAFSKPPSRCCTVVKEMSDKMEFLESLAWEGEANQPSEQVPENWVEYLLKRCPGCQEEQSSDNFYKESAKKDGLSHYCKTCTCAKAAIRKRRAEPEDTSPESSACDSLYIMTNSMLPGMVKIGRSGNPEERAKQLSVSQPFRVVVERSYGGKGFLEKTLHDRLKRRRVEGGGGREWYRISPEQADILIKASIVEHEIRD